MSLDVAKCPRLWCSKAVLRRIRQFATLVTLGAVACSAQLPSEQPLGVGPLARLRRSEPSGAPVSMPGSQTADAVRGG